MHYKSIKTNGIRAAFILLVCNLGLLTGQTTVLFQPDSVDVGPFPSNALTLADSTQMTGLRVNLPSSNDSCDLSPSPAVCSNSGLLNQLDGFSVNPRLMVCFSAAVDPNSLQSGIQIVSADGRSRVGINQLIYEPTTNCAFAKPNQVLNQQSRYLLIVTDRVHDSQGNSVREGDAFRNCSKSSDPNCQALDEALEHVRAGGNIVGASLFTTMSATNWLEQARRYVDATEPPVVLPAGSPTSFAVSNLKSITWNADLGNGSTVSQDIPLTALSGVGQIAFGEYLTRIFQDPATGTIPVTPTNLPIVSLAIPLVRVSFHVFLPAGSPPRGGFPVVIYGHGLGDNQFGAPTFIASTLAKSGFATLAIEITGHGYGPKSTVSLTDSAGVVHTVATPGRGVSFSGPGGLIGPTDGCIVPGAPAIRDCGRQTAVDLFALVQTIRKTRGLGVVNPGRIYYVGQSFGSTYGTLFQAVEPNVGAAVLNGDGGTSVDVARLAITGRPLAIGYLASVNPALLNVGGADFNDNYVFRDSPPVVNNVGSAMAIQAAFEAADWLGMLGDPLGYATHLRSSPLPGVPVKSTLFQFGLGDLEVPNPTESAVVRAAGAQRTAWYLRFDEAVEKAPDLAGLTYDGLGGLPILPHRILSNPTVFEYPDETALAMAEQQQVAAYFAGYGLWNPNPNWFLKYPFAGMNLFQIPATLPEQLNYFQLQP